MLKINDNRDDGYVTLQSLYPDAFFEYREVICRRISHNSNEILLSAQDDDSIPIIEMPTSTISALDRLTWVKPIPNDKISLEIER